MQPWDVVRIMLTPAMPIVRSEQLQRPKARQTALMNTTMSTMIHLLQMIVITTRMAATTIAITVIAVSRWPNEAVIWSHYSQFPCGVRLSAIRHLS